VVTTHTEELTMTDACQNTTRLDDAALDSVCGGIVRPQLPFTIYIGPDGEVVCGKPPGQPGGKGILMRPQS
jgi:hypothetical protein